jgi:hypothetical protein
MMLWYCYTNIFLFQNQARLCTESTVFHINYSNYTIHIQFSSVYFRFNRSSMAIKAKDIEHVNIHKSTQIKQNKTIKAIHNIKPCYMQYNHSQWYRMTESPRLKNIQIKSTEQITIQLSYMYKLHKLKNKTYHNITHKEARIKTSNKKLYKPLQSLATTAQVKTSAHHRFTTALHRRYSSME